MIQKAPWHYRVGDLHEKVNVNDTNLLGPSPPRKLGAECLSGICALLASSNPEPRKVFSLTSAKMACKIVLTVPEKIHKRILFSVNLIIKTELGGRKCYLSHRKKLNSLIWSLRSALSSGNFCIDRTVLDLHCITHKAATCAAVEHLKCGWYEQ